jgi:ubiquitin fusion degradation protein 1
MDFFSFHRPAHRHQRQAFFDMLKAFPASFFGKEEVEKGNMSIFHIVILPSSSAHLLVEMSQNSPMLFKITNTQLGFHSHCGVLEFTADEGCCLLPYWVRLT